MTILTQAARVFNLLKRFLYRRAEWGHRRRVCAARTTHQVSKNTILGKKPQSLTNITMRSSWWAVAKAPFSILGCQLQGKLKNRLTSELSENRCVVLEVAAHQLISKISVSRSRILALLLKYFSDQQIRVNITAKRCSVNMNFRDLDYRSMREVYCHRQRH